MLGYACHIQQFLGVMLLFMLLICSIYQKGILTPPWTFNKEQVRNIWARLQQCGHAYTGECTGVGTWWVLYEVIPVFVALISTILHVI